MIENKKNTTTGEPVKEQAPASTEASTTAAPVIITEQTPAIPTKVEPPVYPVRHGIIIEGLPAGYLSSESLLDENGVMSPDYLEKYPEALAYGLKPLKASTFHRAFLTKAKEANKKKVPYSTKKNCAQGMVLQAMKLVNRKKDPAPKILLNMMKLVTATVVDDATFEALYVHLDAVYTFLLMN